MNKYAMSGLLDEAQAGRSVVVLSGTHRSVRDAFEIGVEHAGPGARVRRTNGAERIDFPAASVRFASVGSSRYRGMSADTLFIDWDADISGDRYADAIVATSVAPQIVRA